MLKYVKENASGLIKDKKIVQRFFNYPPIELMNSKLKKDFLSGEQPVFYKDTSYNYKNVLLSGKEFVLFINEIHLFNFWYLITWNMTLSAFLTYTISRIIGNYRKWIGKKNLSENSKIDSRFLI